MTEAEWLAGDQPKRMLEFLARLDLHPWLEYSARVRVSERKLRLVAVACCRTVWDQLSDQRSRDAVEAAEQAVDGRLDEKERVAAAARAFDATIALAGAREPDRAPIDRRVSTPSSGRSVRRGSIRTLGGLMSARTLDEFAPRLQTPPPTREEMAARAAFDLVAWNSCEGYFAADTALRVMPGDTALAAGRLLHCLIGNPFRLARVRPAWLTWDGGTVPRLAQAAYHERHLPTGTLGADRLTVLADALEEAGCIDQDILSHLRGPGPHFRGCWVVDLVLGKT